MNFNMLIKNTLIEKMEDGIYSAIGPAKRKCEYDIGLTDQGRINLRFSRSNLHTHSLAILFSQN